MTTSVPLSRWTVTARSSRSAQEGRAAGTEVQPLRTPDPPDRSRMGMTRVTSDDPVGPGTGELLVDPRPRQGCQVALGAVDGGSSRALSPDPG